MKKLLTGLILTMLITAGCSSTDSHITLDKKHTPFPDFVLASQPIVQETIAREAVQMHKDGKTPKEIYLKTQAKYQGSGQPTPTLMPTE